MINGTEKISLVPKKQKTLYTILIVFFIITYLLSLYMLNLDFKSGLTGLKKAGTFILRLLMIDFSDWSSVFSSAAESMAVAVFATILSSLIAFITSFFAASNVSINFVTWIIKGLVAIIRAVPTIIWTLIFVAYLGFGPFPGVLGLFFHSYAYLVKAFAESIEEVKPGCIEAIKATGASWIQIMARGVIPTIKTSVISWTALRFEINVGVSTILGLVGAGGIGYELSKNMRMFNFEKTGFVILIIFIMSFGIEMIFNKMKLNVDKKRLEA